MRRIAGFTIETQRVVIKAPGNVTAPACLDDPTDCCAERPPEVPCCPEDAEPLASLFIVLTAPVGSGSDEITFGGYLDLTAGGVWETPQAIEGTNGLGASACELMARVYCDPETEAWTIEGGVTDFAGQTRSFTGELTAEGAVLTGMIALVGEDDPMVVTVEHPCGSGDCCDALKDDVLDFAAGAPVGADGGAVVFESTISPVEGEPGVWEIATPLTGDDASSTITAYLYCAGGWHIRGVVTDAQGDQIPYLMAMEDQGTKLHGRFELPPDYNGDLVIDIETPCDSGSGSGSGSGVACEDAISLASGFERHDCNAALPDPGNWYKFVAPSSGSYNFEFLSDGLYNHAFSFYDDCGGEATAEFLDSGGSDPEYVLSMSAGQTVWILIRSVEGAPSDCYTVSIAHA